MAGGGIWTVWLTLVLLGAPSAEAATTYHLVEEGTSCAQLGLQDRMEETQCRTFAAENPLGLMVSSLAGPFVLDSLDYSTIPTNCSLSGCSVSATSSCSVHYGYRGMPYVVFGMGGRSVCIGSTTSESTSISTSESTDSTTATMTTSATSSTSTSSTTTRTTTIYTPQNGEQANQGYDSIAAAIPAWAPGAVSGLVLLLCFAAFTRCLPRRLRRSSPGATEKGDVEAGQANHGQVIHL